MGKNILASLSFVLLFGIGQVGPYFEYMDWDICGDMCGDID